MYGYGYLDRLLYPLPLSPSSTYVAEQYNSSLTCTEEYRRFLEAHQVIGSMSAVGSCADNVAVESFFGVLKYDRVNRQPYRTRAEARADIFDYIERCHNPRQRRRLDMQHQAEQLFSQPSVMRDRTRLETQVHMSSMHQIKNNPIP